MKGEMALDYIVKFLIVLVVAGVVIGLFMASSEDARNALHNMFFPDVIKLPVETSASQTKFSAGEIANYIESCYSNMERVPEASQKDIVCYVLMANNSFSTFTSSAEVSSALSKDIRDKVHFNTDFQRAYLKIEFRELGNEIIVS